MPPSRRADPCRSGTILKALFTIGARWRYSRSMLWIAAAAITVSAPESAPRPSAAAIVQARATVRIVQGTRIRFERTDAETPPLRAARIRTDAGPQAAHLIEFE